MRLALHLTRSVDNRDLIKLIRASSSSSSIMRLREQFLLCLSRKHSEKYAQWRQNSITFRLYCPSGGGSNSAMNCEIIAPEFVVWSGRTRTQCGSIMGQLKRRYRGECWSCRESFGYKNKSVGKKSILVLIKVSIPLLFVWFVGIIPISKRVNRGVDNPFHRKRWFQIVLRHLLLFAATIGYFNCFCARIEP